MSEQSHLIALAEVADALIVLAPAWVCEVTAVEGTLELLRDETP